MRGAKVATRSRCSQLEFREGILTRSSRSTIAAAFA
jgi:hypothetical protein